MSQRIAMPRKAKRPVLEVFVPVVDYQDVSQALSGPPVRPMTVDGKRVALLPNFRAISQPFLGALAQRIASTSEVERAFVHDRSDWAFNHPERAAKIGVEIDEFVRECELAISGIGD